MLTWEYFSNNITKGRNYKKKGWIGGLREKKKANITINKVKIEMVSWKMFVTCDKAILLNL